MTAFRPTRAGWFHASAHDLRHGLYSSPGANPLFCNSFWVAQAFMPALECEVGSASAAEVRAKF